ncbi:zymogen granule membrane protein 16-like [Sinocyclocheilus grahami]|uniref:Zymogen granule membrane protein 16-like n=1 Tax=Sinocyclocheilus grahami TaxID=75366 RepID=A0A672PM03_SINGR|nr:PREDICTED: zymogen granule membrane protein 16-like [Sinocyclocheilus grahami]
MLNLILVLSGVCTVGMAMPLPDFYSYSLAAGEGSGTEYSTAHVGRITGIRIWEYSSAYIGGIQLSYDGNWTTLVCANYGTQMEMTLLDNESIVQVSGKYDYGYIYELMFVTSQGRSFKVGQPSGISFNFYPTHDGSELRFLSGRHNGYGITSIGAHWAVYHTSDNSVTP